MKKNLLSLLLAITTVVLQAQNTNYGVNSGTGGTENSFLAIIQVMQQQLRAIKIHFLVHTVVKV